MERVDVLKVQKRNSRLKPQPMVHEVKLETYSTGNRKVVAGDSKWRKHMKAVVFAERFVIERSENQQ
jgi:hypothetical protein